MTKRRSNDAQSTVDHTTPSLTTTSPHTNPKKPCQHDTRETPAVTTTNGPTNDPTTMPREGVPPISAKRKRETAAHDSAGSDDVETTAKSLDQLRLTERKQDMQTWQARTSVQLQTQARVSAIHQDANNMLRQAHDARQARAEEAKRAQQMTGTIKA
jgi:hypothetical protein